MAPPDPAQLCSYNPQGSLRENIACVFFALLVGWFYVWCAQQPVGGWTISSKSPNGYYGLETAGFRSGHLYAAIEPLPGLLALPDAYDPVANAPYRTHDMSFYKGHYYLYFGVTPVFLLFWPAVALTGRYVSEPFAVATFCTLAVWAGMGLLLAIRRRHFPGAPFVALLAGWLCLAWATPLTLLVEGPQFYQVPISCAIFLQAAMLCAVYRALHSPVRALAWMAAAGLLFGLSVGARPNHLAGFCVLLVPIAYVAWREGGGIKDRAKPFLRGLLWTFIPTALCGAALLYYNWARFGSVTEFGMHYQLAGEKVTGLTAMSPRFLLPHVAYYLFTPGHWGSYFPFFSATSGQPFGLVRYVPWTWLMLAAFLFPTQGAPGERAGRVVIAWALAAAFLSNLALLACFFGTTGRYPGDYANAALILAGMGALSLGQRAAARRGRSVKVALTFAALVSFGSSLAVFVGGFPRPEILTGAARLANLPVDVWQKAHGVQFGGLRLQLRLAPTAPGLPEPLLETGIQSDQRDWIDIEYLPLNRARLRYFHAGAGFFPGTPFEIPGDRRVEIEAQLGSLLPPFGHPVFSGWSREDYNRVKREVRLVVNGKEVLRAAQTCYDSSPATTERGRLAWVAGGERQVFTGEILRADRLALRRPPAVLAHFKDPRPIELSLMLPASRPPGPDPILATGKGTASDILYCLYDGSGGVRIALDHFGSGGPVSNVVHYDPLVPHSLVVWMGSVAGIATQDSSDAPAAGRLVVILDGIVLLNNEQVFYPSTPETAIVGRNPYGATDAGSEFTGIILSARQVDLDSLPALVRNGSFGSVDMQVEFPTKAFGTQEPLLVTGVSGAGDILYVRYLDGKHVLIGFDHWGIGSMQGDPIAIDYARPHRIAISFASLYPPHSPLNRSDNLEVLLDGKAALHGHFACHLSTADEIKIGANPIGGSTCGAIFTGRINRVDRSALAGK